MSRFSQDLIFYCILSMSPSLKLIDDALYHIFDRAKVLILVGLSRRGISFPDFQLLIKSDIFLIKISPFLVLVWLKLANSLTPSISRCSKIVTYFRGTSFSVQFFH